MSTRGTIQRMTPDSPIGSYHHWDSYPDALGKTLWDLWHGYFARDTERMLHVLIDEHPGWSTINGGDFTREPGYDQEPAPACYCHGARHEDVRVFPLADAASRGCEWAYVFYPEQRLMKVLSSYTDGRKMIGMLGQGDPNADWRIVAEVALDDAEPVWDALEGDDVSAI